MVYGVHIRMGNRISLSTVALLSTLWEREQRDYLDVLGQFVLHCLPHDIGSKADVDAVTDKLRAEYGFDDIPRHVVEKIFRRLSKLNIRSKRYLRRENQNYYVVEAFDHRTFDLAQQETNALITDVLTALADYLEVNYLHKKVNADEATDFLFHFFDAYGLTVVHDCGLLRAITTASGAHNFYVARFIIDSFDRKTPVFDKLIKITTGFLIHKAVYFYSAEMKSSIDSKLHDVNFYLDCSLVIDALGYDSTGDENAFDEMNQLIRANGGGVFVFEHTVEEASRVLEAYAHKPQSHNSFSLVSLNARNYPSEVLASIATPQAIQENLKKKNVTIYPSPTYEATRIIEGKPVYDGFEDELSIEKQLLQYTQKKNSILNGDRLSYDAKTLSAIGRLRKDRHPTHIEHCKAMVITQGTILNKCMRDLYPTRFQSEIDFAINDLDIVSLLWLGQRNKKSCLPQNLLIANAVAACQISQDMMDQAIELTCRMELDNTIPSEAALIIRSSAAIRPILFERTQNNPAHLTEETLKQAIADYVVQESQEAAEAAVKMAVDANSVKLNAQHEKEIARIRNELDRTNTLQRQQAIDMRNDAEMMAEKSAQIASRVVRIAVLVLWLVCLVGSVVCWIRGGWIYTNVAAIVLSLLSFLQIVDYLFKIYSLSDRLAKKAHDKVFAIMYAKGIAQREKITRIKLSL